METKEVNEFRDTKPHQKKDWLYNAYVVQGKSVSEISNELNISVKLVHALINEFGL